MKKVLAKLAKSDNGSVISAVINNEFTTQETRDEIYKRYNHLAWVVKELIEWPLSTEIIHDIVENLCPKNVDFWQVAKQQNISTDDLKLIFEIVTTAEIHWGRASVKNATLSMIVESVKVDEELLQKLAEYSEYTAVLVVKKYREFIKVDLNKGQTE